MKYLKTYCESWESNKIDGLYITDIPIKLDAKLIFNLLKTHYNFGEWAVKSSINYLENHEIGKIYINVFKMNTGYEYTWDEMNTVNFNLDKKHHIIFDDWLKQNYEINLKQLSTGKNLGLF